MSCATMNYSKKIKKGPAGMIKRSEFLKEAYDNAFKDELSKMAGPTDAYKCPKCGYEGNKPGKCPKCDAMMVKK